MENEAGRVVATIGPTASTTRVYHRDFPEIQADGHSAREAAGLLAGKISLALDTALTDWRRQTLTAALDDVRAFLDGTK